MYSQINFGYPFYVNYSHLILTLVFLAVLAISLKLKWPKAIAALAGVIALWGLASFIIVQFVFDMNRPTTLPTQAFLPTGVGKVLDMGAGTGRSTLMVLEARPKATVVALDLFGTEYVRHFGGDPKANTADEGKERLLQNLRLAQVSDRATVLPGDMRHMPVESGSFDAVVSAYAIDHLSREGARESAAEAFRVLKPKGQFLMMVIAKDAWLTMTFGPLLIHSRKIPQEYWPNLLQSAGFAIEEQGRPPATLYVLARKP